MHGRSKVGVSGSLEAISILADRFPGDTGVNLTSKVQVPAGDSVWPEQLSLWMLNLAASVPLRIKSSIIKSPVPSLDIVKVSVLGDPIKANAVNEPGETEISGTIEIPDLETERVPLVVPPQ